jgi:hypothetical protein
MRSANDLSFTRSNTIPQSRPTETIIDISKIQIKIDPARIELPVSANFNCTGSPIPFSLSRHARQYICRSVIIEVRWPFTTLSQKSLLPARKALWVLAQFGFRTGGTHSTLLEYMKLLRRFGVPFSPEERVGGNHHHYGYRYEHLMEIAVALSFRLHRIVP